MGCGRGRFYVRIVTVSAVVLVRRDGRELVDRWAYWYHRDVPFEDVRPREWFWDQATLFLAWCSSRLSTGRIPISEFANDQLDAGAAIWSANVADKEGYFRHFEIEYRRQHASRAEAALNCRSSATRKP